MGGEADYLERARHLVERAIRRRWADGLITRDPDGLLTSYLGADEVERLLGAEQNQAAPPPVADHGYDPASPLGGLIARLRLGPSESDLLAVLLACEADPVTARLINYLSGNQTQFSPTLDLLLEIVYRARCERRSEAAAQASRDLAARRLLRRLRFLVVDGADSRVALAQSSRLHPRIVAWLLDDRTLDAELAASAQLVLPDAEHRGEVDPAQLDSVAAAFAAGRLVFVDGPPQSGREMLLRFAAARVGRPLLVVSGRGLHGDAIVAAFREATLHGAILALRETEEALAKEGLLRFRESLEVFPDAVAVIGAGKVAPQIASWRPSTTVEVRVPPVADRLTLWRRYLEGGLPDDDLERVAALYNLGVQGIVNACAAALESARFAGEALGIQHVAAAVRQLFDNDLSTVATRARVTQTWDDLVLPLDVADSVVEIADRIRLRAQVLGKWGFERKLGRGQGLLVLFSGEPGTGKSMAASLIAAELGLDLYVINLSQLVSKWIGETEKNLARAFDASEAGHVLLLFDEADTILGKRTSDMKSSNDRYANLETNYILTRLEAFQGIAFFTTNLPSAIDPAIARRMSVHVHFPFPDESTRAMLWRRMIPAEAPIGKIDFKVLGNRYQLSGGFIRNIVLRAAYLAARDEQPIEMDHVVKAAEDEYRERGLLLVGGRMT